MSEATPPPSSPSFDCPVCFEPFTGDILQCREGHLFCPTCNAAFKKRRCPICRCRLPAVDKVAVCRFAMAENEKRRLDCDGGCGAKGLSPAQLAAHRAECSGESFRCPLKQLARLLQIGSEMGCDLECASERELKEHLENKHQTTLFVDDGSSNATQYCLERIEDVQGMVRVHLFYDVMRQAFVCIVFRRSETDACVVSLARNATTPPFVCVAPLSDAPDASRQMWTTRVTHDIKESQIGRWPRTDTSSTQWLVAWGKSERAAITEFAGRVDDSKEVRPPPTKKRRL